MQLLSDPCLFLVERTGLGQRLKDTLAPLAFPSFNTYLLDIPWLCLTSRVPAEAGLTPGARLMHFQMSVQLSLATGAQDQQQVGGSQAACVEGGDGQWMPWDMHGAGWGGALEVLGSRFLKSRST